MTTPSCYNLLAGCIATPDNAGILCLRSKDEMDIKLQLVPGTSCEILTTSKQSNDMNQNTPKKITSSAEYKMD